MTALNKRLVNRSFAAAANQYDQHAALQRAMGMQLLDCFPPSNEQGIDLGCGTGFLTRQLLLRCPETKWFALDLALPMLEISRERLKTSQNVSYLCADAEALPLASESVGQIFSNLALQWCQNLPVLFRDCRRVLSSEGQLVFSTFGPDTLKELKMAWSQVDDYVHVNEFNSVQVLADALVHSGFKDVSFETIMHKSIYPSVMDLMRELKGLGAHNINSARKSGSTTPKQLQAMIAAYQEAMTDDKLMATYEVFMVRAR